jgi:hypothetical protein
MVRSLNNNTYNGILEQSNNTTATSLETTAFTATTLQDTIVVPLGDFSNPRCQGQKGEFG